jgi:hypothetical protein
MGKNYCINQNRYMRFGGSKNDKRKIRIDIESSYR